MKPYIDKGFFKQLQDKTYFKTVKPHFDSIQWANGQDLYSAQHFKINHNLP